MNAAREEVERLRQKLAEVEAQLESFKSRHQWVESALAAQRHARQVLEAAIAATYADTIVRLRDVVRCAIPRDAIVLVISKGDDELLKLDGRHGWHFPRDEAGDYAGYYPADSADAVEHLQGLIAKGAEYLLLPNTAFWWLEHYRGFEEHLESCHIRTWRDDRCVLYRLDREPSIRPASAAHAQPNGTAPPIAQVAKADVAEAHDIICFPIIDWEYRFQRPQQLMRQFAGAGHQIFYLSHEFRTEGEPYELRRLEDNIREVVLRGSNFKVRQGLLDEESRQALAASLAALRNEWLPGATLAIVQSAFWWPVVKEAAARYGWPVVYDCLDCHAGFATANPLALEQERDLLGAAHLVIASSAVLEAEARQHNRRVLLVRNACDYDHFARVSPKVRGGRPVIGYYGAIAEWFDTDLVAELAERRPDWEFILVGSTVGADTRQLAKMANVVLPGEKPYTAIPDWLAEFDVAILPFRRTALTEATNPVKAYEILAAGKPLVSVPLPEMKPLVPLVRLASTVEEFEREVALALACPDAVLEEKRRAFAQRNTWQDRFEVLAPAFRNLLLEADDTSGRWRSARADVVTTSSALSSRQSPPAKLTVAGVMDEFTAACFRPECHLVTFRPDNWEEVLERNPPDMLFVESAWQGNGGSWQYKIASCTRPMGDELTDLVRWCRQRSIPTIFWNKEDPPHFERFIARAMLFDCVFTSDAQMLPRYRKMVKHKRVFTLPFAAQPRLHHPIQEAARSHRVCFAGAYYAFDHDERRLDLDLLLSPALAFGLHIYDRQHGVVGAEAQAYRFPERYRSAIRGRLEYDEMVRAYKRYKVFLNVNSVKTSPTMFSRRVFELLASGTPVISTYADGIIRLLGGQTVHLTRSESETTAHLKRLLGDPDYWAATSAKGIRAVHSAHTYGHRLAEICRAAGMPPTTLDSPGAEVVAVAADKRDLRRVADTLRRQTRRASAVTLVVSGALAGTTPASVRGMLPPMEVRVTPQRANAAAGAAHMVKEGYVWLLRTEDYYGDNFLEDALLAAMYGDADVIGKKTHYAATENGTALELRQPGFEFRFVDRASPGSVLARAGALNEEQWKALAAGRFSVLPERRILSIDRFNYIRHGGGCNSHARRMASI